MKDNLLLKRAGYNQIDVISLDRAKNSGSGISVFIMNRGGFRQGKAPERAAEFFSHFPGLIAHINQPQLRPKPVTDAFSFRENLIESRREGGRDRNGAVRRGVGHSLSIVSDGAIFRQIAL